MEIIVLVGIPSLTTIAAVGWGALELFSEEKFWRSELSQAALASPCDSSVLFRLLQERSHHQLLGYF